MKLTPWLTAVVILSVSVSGLYYYKQQLSEQQQMQSGPEPSSRVEAARALTAPYQKHLSVIGEGRAVDYVILKNELAGKVSKVNLYSGETVKQGQVLLEQVHSEELAQLAALKATVTLKEQTLLRYQSLIKESRISKESVDVAQAEYNIALADVARLEATIAKKVIKAPFDARVGLHDLSVGQFLDGNTEITELIGLNDFTWVDFKVPQTYEELPLGSLVNISISSPKIKSAQAEVISVEPILTKNSRQLTYRAKVMSSDMILKPNQLVNVDVPIMAERQVLMVPNLAIVRDQLGNYVFKLVQDNQGDYRASRHKVVLGNRVDKHIIVEEGLDVGELVAAKGAFKLRQGLKINFTLDEKSD